MSALKWEDTEDGLYVAQMKGIKDGVTYKAIIGQDCDAESPRDNCDYAGRMCIFMRNYRFPIECEGLKAEAFDNWDEMREYLIKEVGAIAILPLYIYSHSGMTISTAPFSCRWDSGQVGFIYCTEESLKTMGVTTRDERELERMLKGEVEEFDVYLRGEIYYYTVMRLTVCDKCGETKEDSVESLCGLYGLNTAKEEAEAEVLRQIEYDLKEEKK